jgi:uncharacterized protein YbjT (DUF2867 family)
MSRIAVVGGNGQIARLLHPLLVERGHTPVALVRSESYRADLEAAGAEVRLLDIERDGEDAFAAALDGAHAVVFAAGGGPDGNIERKRTVDLEGSLKSIAGARAAGITRFVQVSAINVDEPVPDGTEPVWAAYVEAKLGERVARAEVPRADVAAVLAEVIDTGAGIGAQWNLVSGDTPVADEVSRLGG